MTPSGFLTDEAWRDIVPRLCKGLRHQVRDVCEKHGIDPGTADKLKIGLSFDGFKSHVKNLEELVHFADNNILAVVENRDSSEFNQVSAMHINHIHSISHVVVLNNMLQAFDKFVAQFGKKLAARCLDDIRRSHIMPIIDKWVLILVGLAMLRDCTESRAWEMSFIAVNMHPHHRIPFDDFMEKIDGFVKAADKFEDEHIDVRELLPQFWLKHPLAKRQDGWNASRSPKKHGT